MARLKYLYLKSAKIKTAFINSVPINVIVLSNSYIGNIQNRNMLSGLFKYQYISLSYICIKSPKGSNIFIYDTFGSIEHNNNTVIIYLRK